MRVSLKFLNHYLPTPQSFEAVSEAFVRLGFEIDGIESFGYCGRGSLIVGQVKTKVPHPNSDHLSVCTVDIGQAEPLQIVCGATNFKVGDKVPVALEGARLGDVVLKKTVMRGIESCGMMCSADELGLSASRCPGLMILNDRNPAIGTPLEELFGDTKDVALDVAIPSNRGDCLSYVGLARELCAVFGGAVSETPLLGCMDIATVSDNKSIFSDPHAFLQAQPKPLQPFVMLETSLCDYFSGCRIENITVQPSSEAIQAFLKASGIRPINNVVDITNVVLLEQGQPLHAFDANYLSGALRVRTACAGERLKTLDGVDRLLSSSAIVVADEKNVLSLAGIMGGEESSISENTKNIFIECAYFDTGCIRTASKETGLSSDSSYRFERFVDKDRAPLALVRAISLLRESNPHLRIAFFTESGSCEVLPRIVRVRLGKIQRLLGFEIESQTFCEALGSLNFRFKIIESGVWDVTIPSWRSDVTLEADFAEEFVRWFGTDRIPSHVPGGIVCGCADTPEHMLRQRHAEILSDAGFYECYTDSLQPKAWYEGVLSEEQLSILTLEKPLSEEHACLRFSLVPGLLNVLCDNRNRGNRTERLFETGRIFKVDPKGQLYECFATAFVACPLKEKTWKSSEIFDFYRVQALVRSLIAAGGQVPLTVLSAETTSVALWQEGYSGKIGRLEQRGFETNLGYLNLNWMQQWFDDEAILAAECFWLTDRIRIPSKNTFQPYAETPTVTKDLALWVPKATPCETVRQSLVKVLKKIVKHPVQMRDVRIFDVFDDLENDRKSFAFTIEFGAVVGTLKDEQVRPIFEMLQSQIEQQEAYQVRKA